MDDHPWEQSLPRPYYGSDYRLAGGAVSEAHPPFPAPTERQGLWGATEALIRGSTVELPELPGGSAPLRESQ
jgi:hypothetical protein